MTKPQWLHCACPTENSGPTLGRRARGSSMWSLWAQVFSYIHTQNKTHVHTGPGTPPGLVAVGPWPLASPRCPLTPRESAAQALAKARTGLLRTSSPGSCCGLGHPGIRKGTHISRAGFPLFSQFGLELTWIGLRDSLTKYQLCPCRSANHGKLEPCRWGVVGTDTSPGGPAIGCDQKPGPGSLLSLREPADGFLCRWHRTTRAMQWHTLHPPGLSPGGQSRGSRACPPPSPAPYTVTSTQTAPPPRFYATGRSEFKWI